MHEQTLRSAGAWAIRWFTLLPMGLLLAACTTPTERIQWLARQANLHQLQLTGNAFHLTAYRNAATGAMLHVYLSGDGTPWRNRYAVSTDPTPRHPLTLRLMMRDPAPAIYLARPCYQGHTHDHGCNPLLWTRDRYGVAVVTAMAAGLRSYLQHRRYHALVLIGYSGGGTLALLLAPRLPATRMVVTIAGNLDTAAWTSRHDYSPLTGSLNPADQPPLPSTIRQLHFAGDRDRIVPLSLIRAALARQPCAELYVIPGYNHQCCWLTAWPELLPRIRRTLAAPACHNRHLLTP